MEFATWKKNWINVLLILTYLEASHVQRTVLNLTDHIIRVLFLWMLSCPLPNDYASVERATDNFEKCSSGRRLFSIIMSTHILID